MHTVWSHVTWSGLEILFEVTMKLADTEKNRLALTKYEASAELKLLRIKIY